VSGRRRLAPVAADDRLAAVHNQLLHAVEELLADGAWQHMLTLAARLPSYSANNILLIMAQRPDATRVAGIRTWNSLGRRVRRGEKGIAILAPCTYRHDEQPREEEQSHTAAADPDTRRTEAPSAKTLRGFRVVHVFDIAQTEGPPLDALDPAHLAGRAPDGIWTALCQLASADGFTVERAPCGPADGLTDYAHRHIRIRPDVDDAHATVTLAQEIGHIRAEHDTRFADTYTNSARCRGLAEIEAESIAFLVASAAGLDAAPASVPYIAGWARGDPSLVRDTANLVLDTSRGVLADMGMLTEHDRDRPRVAGRFEPPTSVASQQGAQQALR